MTLETKRLLLRPYEAGDWVDYVAYFNDPEMWRMMGYRPFEREEDFRGDFQWRLENPGVTALVLKESGHVVGHICAGELYPPLLEREELRGKKGVSLSFSLHRALRRQGLMRGAGGASGGTLSLRRDRLRQQRLFFLQRSLGRAAPEPRLPPALFARHRAKRRDDRGH